MINEIIEIGKFMAGAFLHAWPYLLVTIPLAVLVNVSGISKYIEKTFNAKPLIAILLATIVGAFSPFCSCGVIPIISALLIGGVPLAPVMSFWLASPSMDPEAFFLSASQLGMDLAIWRLAGTFAMSLFGGYITHYLIKIKWLGKDVMKVKYSQNSKIVLINPIKILKAKLTAVQAQAAVSTVESCSCSENDSAPMPFESYAGESEETSCTTESCDTSCVTEKSEEEPRLLKKVLNESKAAVFMIVKFMSLAFFLEEWIINLLGKKNSFAIPVSALIGIPLYTTNLTALGLMGGLLKQGMDPGAVLAFLIGGATTTIPAMAAVYGIVKKRVFILYVGFALTAALLTGYLYLLFNSGT